MTNSDILQLCIGAAVLFLTPVGLFLLLLLLGLCRAATDRDRE